MIKVKVCGMRDALNIKDVSDAGPDYMGFIFYPKSPRYVGDDPDPAIFTPGVQFVQKVGVFVNEKTDRILEITKKYSLSYVQLHGAETPEHCSAVKSAGIRVIKAFGVGITIDYNSLSSYISNCDYFLLDTRSDQHGGTGMKFNWDIIRQYQLDMPFFLSGGIGPEDAAAIVAIQHPFLYAVDINSRFEYEPGVKNVHQVRKFIKDIKNIAK